MLSGLSVRFFRCSRIASVSWAPTVITGLSDVIGSWKIIAISPPRMLRIILSDLRVNSDRPRRISPEVTRSDALGKSPMMASEVTDLPEPDSPARHSVSPAARSKDTRSRMRFRPVGVRASTESSLTEMTGPCS